MKKTLNLFLAIAFALGIPLSAFGENILVLGAGITQGTADSIYMKRDGSNDPDITGNLAATVAGNPLSLTNTTDSVDNIGFTLYSNRGTGATGDILRTPVYMDDDGGTKLNVGSWIYLGDDLAAKGGGSASVIWRARSGTPIDVIRIDAVNDLVGANFFSVCLPPTCTGNEVYTGMLGSVTQLDYKINNLSAWQVTPTEFRFLAGRNMVIDDGLQVADAFAVGLNLGALDGSVLAGFASTTQGTIPAPKMTSTQRDNIGTPDEGLFVYDLTNNVPNFHNGTGFRAFLHIAASSLTPGSVPFADGTSSLADDNANLFWDNTDNQLGIGTNTPDDSAILDVASTTAGILPPRMTTAQLGAISSPATGLFGFNTTTGTPQYYDSSAWVNFAGPATKAGVKTSGSFSGNPQTVTVTFNTAFPDANYSVSINGSDVRDWSVDSQVAASFVINSNAAQALSASVYWTAIAHYDP